MSDSAQPAPRPARVTFAAVLGTAGCAVLVASLFDTMARLQGTDARQEIAEVIGEPPLRGSGVSVDQVLTGLRVLGYTAGALAAAGVVLAVFCALRHRGARVGFTVVAVLLLVTMPTTGVLPVLPAVAAALLWRRDSRDWFAGRAPQPAATGAPTRVPPYSPPTGGSDRPPLPAPAPAPRQEPQQPQQQPAPWADPYATPPSPPWQGPAPGHAPERSPGNGDRRPGTVTAAAVLSLFGAVLGLLAGLSVLGVLALSPGTIEDAIAADGQLERLDIAMEQVEAMLWGTGAVLVLWSLVAIVLAFLTLRRNTVARVLLAVSAGMAALFSLLAILSGVAAVTLLLGAGTVVLLFTGGANDWFAHRPGRDPAQRVSGSGPPW